MTEQQPPTPTGAPIGFVEFVALIASLMSLTALGIDAMLPALPAIGDDLRVAAENSQQFVITAFVAGFGIAQLFHGPLADRFGRRRMLIVALLIYAAANIAAAAAQSFTLLLIARAAAGAAIAGGRVATVAIVRDCYQGRAMARVMSITFMVFMIVPVLAPALGQGVLAIYDSWRLIFCVIAAIALAVLGWFAWRMPETLAPENELPLSPSRIARSYWQVVTDRWSLGYTLAAGCLVGALYGYLNSVTQIMADTFGRPELLTVVFAATAGLMAVASLTNARLVMRVGTRRLSHGALVGMLLLGCAHYALERSGSETLLTFAILQALTMACFGIAATNFSSMAMGNMGGLAGTASSVQGFGSVTLGSLIGLLIGQAFDGTTAPLAAGYALSAALALAIVFWTERGKLFRPA
ncbi:MAG: transporter [Sphingomonas bacterium]|uniref:multidrug effflux MFS transporter n=1 Tax=Sphingomonas bacterium TaxID=1895847 RepID=UPI0026136864|nr:multidrug effflux MFS transporter [Sphingomonas bacterium]MDB5694572.1 transporter [Sphingomonas bacterium]